MQNPTFFKPEVRGVLIALLANDRFRNEKDFLVHINMKPSIFQTLKGFKRVYEAVPNASTVNYGGIIL